MPTGSTEDYARRVLHEREKAREAGDKLAVAVREYLDQHGQHPELEKAIRAYCKTEGWNGPSGSWVEWLEKK